MQEFIDSLKLPYKGKMINNQYIIDVESSDKFSELFNAVSLNNLLNLEDKSVATVDEAKFTFTNGEYDVKLEAVKNYVYLKVRVTFDPPTSSSVLEAYKQQLNELEWRLNVQAESVENFNFVKETI